MIRSFLIFLIAASIAGCATVDSRPAQTTLDKIKASNSVTLGYREGAVPFAFLDKSGKPIGYSVELCERVIEGIRKHLELPALAIKWVPVSGETRFQQVLSGEVDLECGTTTITLSRQAQVDFSLMTFLDGGAFLARAGPAPKALDELQRMSVAVSTGTTTEDHLRKVLEKYKINLELVPVKSHAEGIALLREGKVALYASDRTVLIGLALSDPQASGFVLPDLMLSYEPYGLMLRRDPDFRLAINRVLAGIYRSGEIIDIYRRWFGPLGEPTDLLKAMYLIQALPE
ncbi:MAG TPA: amino acid ABC transporter substrate-binding protein [Burkholderiales bacterium]|nr:amino acid ABC transporter substrate-binding protein [Burkholderiales bacterium]